MDRKVNYMLESLNRDNQQETKTTQIMGGMKVKGSSVT